MVPYHPCADCRFTCDWDPPAGHDWAGYPIRADAGMQGLIDKTLDPKKQYRCKTIDSYHLQQMQICTLALLSASLAACLLAAGKVQLQLGVLAGWQAVHGLLTQQLL